MFDPAEEINNETAHAIIRRVILDGGRFILTRHAKERMKLRGYTTHDVEYILTHGGIIEKKFNDRAGNWSYKIRGDDLEGDEGGVVTAIIQKNAILIITVLS
ncbi:DUF4258 domain-containing protein [Desulfogranum marinum]|uniref:DUF4258 domain-containing protein n=1 Tax=Desulfogranum marinum TaxID=453220 RepID=UPI0029C763F2|nr:DUF4258 domain-containing protein [Desulfogranum marinum]